MARRANKEVDKFYHSRSGLWVYVYLTPENKFVTNELLGEPVHHDTAEGCKSAAWKKLDAEYAIEFKPMIEIKREKSFDFIDGPQSAIVGLSVRRYYYAINSSGHILTVKWEPAERNPSNLMRFAERGGTRWRHDHRFEFELPAVIDEYSLLPYTEETWNAVMHLVSIIKMAQEKLNQITRADDAGLARFQEVGRALSLLLPGGE